MRGVVIIGNPVGDIVSIPELYPQLYASKMRLAILLSLSTDGKTVKREASQKTCLYLCSIYASGKRQNGLVLCVDVTQFQTFSKFTFYSFLLIIKFLLKK